jgi:GT2 family glycosyltransferase
VPRVTVVIPNWNGERFLGPCLSSLSRQIFRDFEMLVVDNGSTDDSLALLAHDFPGTRIISLGENRGFSAAANAGIRNSDTELVALLNNDTEQDTGWLSALVQAADSHRESGSFASKLLDHADRRFLDGAGDALRRSGLPYRLGHGETDRGQYETPAHVFGACAAAALYRREMLEEVGLFDEDFFAYCEDGDLSFRAQLAGYKCLYVPKAVVYHVGSASTGGKRSAFATRLGSRNSLLLLVKNLPLPLLPASLPFIFIGQVVRLGLTALSPATRRAHLEGLADAWLLLPKMLEKRREVQQRRRVPLTYVSRLLSESSRRASVSLLRRLRDRVPGWAGR